MLLRYDIVVSVDHWSMFTAKLAIKSSEKNRGTDITNELHKLIILMPMDIGNLIINDNIIDAST